MKYIKTFESLDDWVSKEKTRTRLEELCNDYLAYLKDDGFKTLIKKFSWSNGGYIIVIYKDKFFKFTWEQIKDQLIPFLQVLNEEMQVYKIEFGKRKSLLEISDNNINYHIQALENHLPIQLSSFLDTEILNYDDSILDSLEDKIPNHFLRKLGAIEISGKIN